MARRRNNNRRDLDERVVDIRRVSKVIKGGRRFAFRTVVVVGDNNGSIGIGIGKARGVPDSIRKASDRAHKSMKEMALVQDTIPYEVTGIHGGAQVLLKPAAPGTGVIAGGGVRAVLEAVGVRNILSKSQGSDNVLNVTMATIDALKQLKSPQKLAEIRGVPVRETTPVWMRRGMGGDEAAAAVAEMEEVSDADADEAEADTDDAPESVEDVTVADKVDEETAEELEDAADTEPTAEADEPTSDEPADDTADDEDEE